VGWWALTAAHLQPANGLEGYSSLHMGCAWYIPHPHHYRRLEGSQPANLQPANLQPANLQLANLQPANLQPANPH
jgi:uncharacterized protein YjbI with pentapeptide repeats